MPTQPSSHPDRHVLRAFAAHRLPAPAAEAIDHHLQLCPGCRALLEDATTGALPDARSMILDTATPRPSSDPVEAPPEAPEIPAELAACAKYRMIRRLGAGGMGEVYLAEQPEIGRLVALKVMRPELLRDEEMLQRFFTEVKVAALLSHPPHPNIATAYDKDRIEDRHILVMEYVPGIDLARLVAEKGPLPVRAACDLIRQVALALEYAHTQTPPIFHRDIKPSNLMVLKNRQVKILDFGLARLGRKNLSGDGLTRSGTFLGTAEYVAPEQAFDASRADARSDIYSLGCTLYLLLTGAPPFRGPYAVMQRLTEELELVHRLRAEVPEALSLVVSRMLERKAEERYSTAGELAGALGPFCRKETGSPPLVQATRTNAGSPALEPDTAQQPAEVSGKPPTLREQAFRRALLASGAAVGILGLVGLVCLVFFGRHSSAVSSFENSYGMTLVALSRGTFTMGSPKGEEEPGAEEEQHEVSISPFYIGRTEVTQKQFRKVMSYNPSYFSNNAEGKEGIKYESAPGGGKKLVEGQDTEEFPVDNVSWEEANAFCEKLTKLDTRKPDRWMYRLPREAEWEYACRGGARAYQTFHFGNSISGTQANFNSESPYGGASRVPPLNRTSKVGSYQDRVRHPFGLVDMHGNVCEWCADWYGSDYYKTSPPTDPPGPPGGSLRVLRGGCWRSLGLRCRSALRISVGPGGRSRDLGFRAALVPLERK
jgi:formylglycine-generating enzyme required for sulfatase activity